MEFNRNQYFMVGIVVVLLGIQFRLVESYLVTPEVTARIQQRFGTEQSGSTGVARFVPNFGPTTSRKTIHVPDWLGWAVTSVGAVLVLHILAMPRPGT